jgi:hypothetical protein
MAVKQTDDWQVSTSITTQVRLDGDSTKALLNKLLHEGLITEDQHRACFKELSFEVMRVNRLDKSKVEKFEMPDFSNYTFDGFLNELGVTKEKKKNLTKLEGILKERINMELTALGLRAEPEAKVEKQWADMNITERMRALPGRTIEEKMDAMRNNPDKYPSNIPLPEEDDEDDTPPWAQ